MAFSTKLRNSQGALVWFVNIENAGSDIWHCVLVDKLKLPLFRQALKTDYINVTEYGKVLYSGWGKEVPPEIVDKIKKEYS